MPGRRFLRAASVVALVSCSTGLLAGATPDLASRVQEELARLESTFARLDGAALPETVRGIHAAQRPSLDAARQAGAPLFVLYRLRAPFVSLAALDLVAAHPEAANDLAAFHEVWTRLGAPYAGSEPGPTRGSPVARALQQTARNRAEKLYRAALPYAKASSPLSGLFYLGEAEGERRFGELAAALAGSTISPGEPPPSAEALLAALEGLDRETLAAFAADPTSPAMIPVSARLKEARELLDRGSLDGAALAVLESRLGLSRRLAAAHSTPPLATPPLATPRESDAPAEGSVLALLRFLEGEASAPEGTAALVRSDVVPLYTALYGRQP